MGTLVHLDEFKTLLQNYSVSEATKQALKRIDFVALVAPTSSGRNTIIRELLKTGNYRFVVSDTTRAPRENDGIMERDGVEYWFRSEEEVLIELRAGEMLEAAVIHNQQISGISLRELKTAITEDKIAITDMEIMGVATIKRLKPDAKVIYVLPPGFEEWQRRLMHRGKMTKPELQRRMESASQELAAALQHDYYLFVVNDDVDRAAEVINSIARFDSVNNVEQTRGRQIAEQLYIETRTFLGAKQTS
ncbi:MAG: guanylate kinase [Candidatus Saccharibacteria bacterium]|nr:guanylate kinase [Candidatus Saccharibacteria bacterium]